MGHHARCRLGSVLPFRGVLVLGMALVSACGRSMVPVSSEATRSAALTSAAESLQSTDGAPSVVSSDAYMVVWTPPDGLLPVREPAGTQGAVVDGLPRDQRGIRLSGRTTRLGSSVWVEILRPAGGTGWVNSWNLTEEVSPSRFCADSRARGLIERLRATVAARDGSALRELISPRHGLAVRIDWWNPEILFPLSKVPDLFRNRESVEWGVEAASGSAVDGTFAQVVLPGLDTGLSEAADIVCNELATGQTARSPEWPGEYANLNYYSIYRPATPIARFGWQTWAIGFEYVDGEPYVTVLVQYRGEI